MRMILVGLLTMFLVLPNLQPQGVTGLGHGGTGLSQGVARHVATGPPLNCGVFSTGKLIDLTQKLLFDHKKMLNQFIACIGANSFLDIDGLYFTCPEAWYGEIKCTGLMAATTLGFNDLARTLIHYDANINVRNEWGVTTLILAASNGNNDMIGILLGLGAHVNGGDNYSYTPLHAAAHSGHMSTVRLLLENGADINARIYFGRRWTALDYASHYGHTGVVALLQSWGR